MVTLNGHSTPGIVKLQIESIISYNLGVIEDVGSYVCESPGSGTFEENEDYTLPAGGKDLVVRANQNIESESDMVVTVTGTDQASAPLTGTATIKGKVAEGQAYNVEPAVDGKKFLTVTSVTATNGVAGDGFDLCVLPDSDDDVEVAFDQGLTINPGKEIKPIYKKYNLSHNKRVRGDRTMSLSGFYTTNEEGLARIANREVTLRQDIKDDGGNQSTEVIYIDKCRLGNTREAPAADDGELTNRAEGSYGRLFFFS